ncbi:terminase small subunit [Klebsiella pneumoniae]|uniref:terminase small subunit n=1 Tax=Klebsiella quasipneumoniae TaxID=1463165 RepID=UPI0009081576|nr:terminase small subunit [Klebsiella quasipneumoniae]QOR78449.1 terminase small subunit [Klebsiella pneumoniae]QOX12211.1 terminase small subunit [Klebsiella pneumoniae]
MVLEPGRHLRLAVPAGGKNGLKSKIRDLRIEYLIDFNVTKARGGGSEKTANEQGARLLANVSISQRISGLKSERNERNKINADFIPR